MKTVCIPKPDDPYPEIFKDPVFVSQVGNFMAGPGDIDFIDFGFHSFQGNSQKITNHIIEIFFDNHKMEKFYVKNTIYAFLLWSKKTI